jgi:hypothetical protein
VCATTPYRCSRSTNELRIEISLALDERGHSGDPTGWLRPHFTPLS